MIVLVEGRGWGDYKICRNSLYINNSKSLLTDLMENYRTKIYKIFS